MAMIRLMIQADEELVDRVKKRAADRGISVAQLARDALVRELGEPAPQPPVSFIGKYASGGGFDARAETEAGSVPPVSSPFSDLPDPDEGRETP